MIAKKRLGKNFVISITSTLYNKEKPKLNNE